jgi:hypothetical protein
MSLTEYSTPAEARVARKLVREALRRGYTVSVNDSLDGDGEWVVRRSTSIRDICSALATTGGDILRFRRTDRPESYISFVLVWGNDPDGSELIADHTDAPEADDLVRSVFG